jgi:outer membrane protein TolC
MFVMKRIKYLVFAFLLGTPLAVVAQSETVSDGSLPPSPASETLAPTASSEPVTETKAPVRLGLEACIKRALANSNALAAERERLNIMDHKVNQAYWAPFSNFKITGSATMVPDKCIDEEALEDRGVIVPCGENDAAAHRQLDEYDYSGSWGPKLDIRADFGIPLLTFGKITNSWDAVKAARSASQSRFPKFAQQIRYNVKQAYNAVLGAREMLYTIGKGRKHLVKARRKVEEDLENQEGTVTEVDLIKLKVFESEVTQYETQSLEIERLGLSALRFLVGGADKDRVDTVDKPQERDSREIDKLEKYKDQALQNRPELKALHHAINATEAKVRLRRSEFYPDLVLVGGFRYGWAPGRTDISNWVLSDAYNYGPGFGIGLALEYKLDLGLDYYRLKEAKSTLTALTLDQKSALDGIMLEVEKVYYHAISTRDSLLAIERSRRLVKGWIAAVTQNHATGLATAKEVKDALAEYFKVMASVHTLTSEYNIAIANLDRTTGDPLDTE